MDDGSIDGSGAILDEYASRDNRFKVVHQKNAGVSAARNVAKTMAIGAWIGFLDGDDAISIHWLEVAHSAAIRNRDSKWVRMGVAFWRCDERPKIKSVSDVHFCEFDHDATIIEGWKSILPHGYPWRNFYSKEILVDNDFNPKLRVQEDMYYSLDLLPSIEYSTWTDYDGYYYRYRQESAWNGKMRLEDAENNLGMLLCVWRKQSDYILRHPDKIVIQRLIGEISVECIVRRFMAQYLDCHKREASNVAKLVKEATVVRAFNPWLFSSLSSRIRWTLFSRTGWWIVFKPLSFFYKFQWLFEI